MEKAKVYFTDFRTVAYGDGLPAKLKKLMRRAESICSGVRPKAARVGLLAPLEQAEPAET